MVLVPAVAAEEPIIEVLPQLEAACTESVVQRTLVLLDMAELVADMHDAGVEQRLEAQEVIKARSQELVSALGAITGAVLYQNPGLPTVAKESVVELRDTCIAMQAEQSRYRQELHSAFQDEMYLAHVGDEADAASHVNTLEQFVLVKSANALPANVRFEGLLFKLLPVDEIEAQINKLKNQL